MNTKTIVIGIALLLVAAGGYYLVNSGTESAALPEAENNNVHSVDAEVSDRQQGRGALMAFLGLGRTVMCTFSHEDTENGFSSDGEFYFDGTSKRFRVDSTTRGESDSYVTHMINDGEFAYVWSEGEDETFAMKMSADIHSDVETQDFDGPGESDNRQVNLEEEVEYDCDSWRVDNSLFVPPTNIEFMDMASMMENMMNHMPEGFEIPTSF